VALTLWVGIASAIGVTIATATYVLWLFFVVFMKAFAAGLVTVSCYRLRVAKEGVDIEQIGHTIRLIGPADDVHGATPSPNGHADER